MTWLTRLGKANLHFNLAKYEQFSTDHNQLQKTS